MATLHSQLWFRVPDNCHFLLGSRFCFQARPDVEQVVSCPELSAPMHQPKGPQPAQCCPPLVIPGTSLVIGGCKPDTCTCWIALPCNWSNGLSLPPVVTIPFASPVLRGRAAHPWLTYVLAGNELSIRLGREGPSQRLCLRSCYRHVQPQPRSAEHDRSATSHHARRNGVTFRQWG
jgi:hypothetical protein